MRTQEGEAKFCRGCQHEGTFCIPIDDGGLSVGVRYVSEYGKSVEKIAVFLNDGIGGKTEILFRPTDPERIARRAKQIAELSGEVNITNDDFAVAVQDSLVERAPHCKHAVGDTCLALTDEGVAIHLANLLQTRTADALEVQSNSTSEAASNHINS